MKHADFTLGSTFWCSGRQWRCTDIGARTIIAIRIDSVTVDSTDPARRQMLRRAEAEAEGFFNGPPYAVAEVVFHEYDQVGCSPEPDPGDPASEPA